ncbi:sulfatase [Brachybacterium phenoliresistens]|uniref:Sulfatase n=1 Tax=Brachybacterium phenoliresistens TaxID=396014 RepID=Z9JPW0_9MICO|nr:sulfatase [Brachybacterium phenoliresistens]EWS79797.1 sulfatase [Brachybacterium phenoliresistens]
MTRPAARPRPSILFVLTDDHAAHAISAYGSRVNSTPSIDRVGAEGARLDAMYCTNSICTPSRASILTGTYSHVNGACSIYSQFDYRVRTFPEVLQERGYRTALYGKWHLGTAEKATPRGFEDWKVFPDQGDYVDPVMYGPGGQERIRGYATDIITAQATSFLDELGADDPFCLLVHHKAPHRPWVPHPRHEHLYEVGTILEPETIGDDHEGRSDAVRQVRMTLDDLTEHDVKEPVPEELRGEERLRERSAWKYQRYMRDYLRTVQAVDDSVATLLDWLEEHDRAEDTIVVYTSDQGFFLGDHGWFDKRLMFDESLTMPFLVRWPGQIPAGTEVEAMATNVDIAATLLEACGVEPAALPAQQGRSLLPWLRGESVEDWPDAVYYRYWEHDEPAHHAPAHYGIRTRTHKLIHYYNDGLGSPGSSDAVWPAQWELYDLVADPAELTNVAEDPAYAGIRAELEAQLARLQADVGDAPYAGPDTPRLDWSV